MKKTITGCHDCPFRYSDFDDFAVGNDTLEICTLAQHEQLPNYFIDCYDTKDDGEPKETYPAPEWCPLQKESLTLELKYSES